MKIWIFDVEHGSCAYAVSDQGFTFLFDCGTNSTTGWTPTKWLRSQGVTRINHLIISHFDQDHVTDIESLAATFPIDDVHYNNGLNLAVVRSQKVAAPGGISRAVDQALQIAGRAANGVIPPSQGLTVALYRNGSGFTDQNNLSLVSLIRAPGMNTVFPGDLEAAGWRSLFANPDFRQLIDTTDFFVASHHGRENGFAGEVFANHKPKLVIISDSRRQFASQEQNYAPYATGLVFGTGANQTIRYVLSTRNDKTITIEPGVFSPIVTRHIAA